MIYIITEREDIVSDLVIEWLLSWNVEFERVNDDTFYEGTLSINNETVSSNLLSNPSKVWHRRGHVNFLPEQLYQIYPNKSAILLYLKKENFFLHSYLEQRMKQKLKKNYIGSYLVESFSNNKIYNLELARKYGLTIPDSLVTTNKSELINFHEKHNRIITKDLNAPVNISTKHKRYVSTGVKEVKYANLMSLPEKFAPIFVQKLIPKAYEVRAFCFNRILYTMAIFSQNDESTKIDYRNYNRKKPNRCVPFEIPKSIQSKLINLFDHLEMETGSIDLIVTTENEFVFLEINPMGQFHWLSENCNYYLENIIASTLTNGQIEF